MIYALALTALCTMPPLDGAAEDRVDLIEHNQMFDDSGRPVLEQMVFYDWCERDSRYNVVAWRLWKEERQPTKLFHVNEYELLWHDGDVLRRVRSKAFVTTWTQHDPELRQRSVFAKEMRRGLTHDDDHYRRSTDTPSEDGLSDP